MTQRRASLASLAPMLLLAGCFAMQRTQPPRPISDGEFLSRLQNLEDTGSLADRDAALQLEPLALRLSPQTAAAAGVELMRGGVYHGNPHLLVLGCRVARSVDDPALRSRHRLSEMQRVCLQVEGRPRPSADPCGRMEEQVQSVFAQLLRDNEAEARNAASAAFDAARRCTSASALQRSPAPPASRSFLVASMLQLLDAPARLWLKNEAGAPELARTIAASGRDHR